MLRQPQIIRLRARAETQRAEIEPDNPLSTGFARQFAFMNHDFFGRGRFAVGKAGEQIGQFGFVFRVIGHVEHFGGRERAHAVIFAAIDIQHGQMAFYQGDGG